MANLQSISDHYRQTGLLEAILAGLTKAGKAPENVTIEDLAPVDEFHVGGREATRSLLDQMNLSDNDTVLDVGCGIGGAARFATATYGCRVIGVDLTDEYVAVGNALCAYVGCDSKVRLETGDVSTTGYDDESFDSAYMLHVGMNIRNKHELAAEIHRLLKPGGFFAIYDLMRVGSGELTFPVPWAESQNTSALTSPAGYREELEIAGFELVSERNRRDFALEFAVRLQAKMLHEDGPPPLGLHLLMGPAAADKYRNMVSSISVNDIAPVEMLARKPG